MYFIIYKSWSIIITPEYVKNLSNLILKVLNLRRFFIGCLTFKLWYLTRPSIFIGSTCCVSDQHFREFYFRTLQLVYLFLLIFALDLGRCHWLHPIFFSIPKFCSLAKLYSQYMWSFFWVTTNLGKGIFWLCLFQPENLTFKMTVA